MVETIAIEQKKNIFLSSSNLIKIRDDQCCYCKHTLRIQRKFSVLLDKINRDSCINIYKIIPPPETAKQWTTGPPVVNDDEWVFPGKISLLQTWFLSRSLRGALRRTIITSKVAKSKGKAVAAKWIKRKGHHWRSDCHVPSQWFCFWQLTKLPSFCR